MVLTIEKKRENMQKAIDAKKLKKHYIDQAITQGLPTTLIEELKKLKPKDCESLIQNTLLKTDDKTVIKPKKKEKLPKISIEVPEPIAQ